MDNARSSGFQAERPLANVPAGSRLRVTWWFHNTGTTTWNTSYSLRYSERRYGFNSRYRKQRFGIDQPIALTQTVAPGQRVAVSAVLTMPESAGTFVAHWQLHDAAGRPFGSLRYVRPTVNNADGFDHATFVKFSSSRTLGSLTGNERVTLRWTVRNSGTSTWDDGYRLAFSQQVAANNTTVPNWVLASADTFTVTELTSDKTDTHPNKTSTFALDVHAPRKRGIYATHWQLRNEQGKAFGPILWTRLVVTADGAPIRLNTGMNINPDHPTSNPLATKECVGLNWVRYPFKIAAKRRDLVTALREYDRLVNRAHEQGLATLFVLNQETVWGEHAPWGNGKSKSWDNYSDDLALTAGKIARRFARRQKAVGFQIWNEGDNAHSPHVSIYVPPAKYALMIEKVTHAIKRYCPDSPVVAMGLATHTNHAIPYLQAVRDALQDGWPVDALAVHPYGHTFNYAPFDNWQLGSMATLLTQYLRAFPERPFWITEVGVANAAAPITGYDNWAGIGRYMRDIYAGIEAQFADRIPVAIWFAWSDIMENAGVLQADGKPKAPILNAFRQVREQRFREF